MRREKKFVLKTIFIEVLWFIYEKHYTKLNSVEVFKLVKHDIFKFLLKAITRLWICKKNSSKRQTISQILIAFYDHIDLWNQQYYSTYYDTLQELFNVLNNDQSSVWQISLFKNINSEKHELINRKMTTKHPLTKKN